MTKSDGKMFVGIDWATEIHQIMALDSEGNILKETQAKHTGNGLAELAHWLGNLGHEPGAIHIAIEVPHGAIVETLLERGFQVFSINPKQLDRFRDRFTMAGAKDDRLDARVLADSLRTDGHLFRHVKVDAALIIELREVSRLYDDLRKERVRATNRHRQLLWRYFPQFLELNPDHGTDWVLDVWKEMPTPGHVSRRRRGTVAKILKKRRIRRITADEVLDILSQPALTVADGTWQATTRHIRLLSDRIRLLNTQLKQTTKDLESLLRVMSEPSEDESKGQSEEQRDAEIILSLPGVGTIVAATLLSEASQLLARRDYRALRSFSGVAPVTRRSGKSIRVVMRKACSHRLRQATYHLARVATQHDPISAARYAALKARGKTHGHAMRVVADRLLQVLTVMLQNRTLFRLAQPKAA